MRKWAEEAIGGAARAGHAYLKKADGGLFGQAGVDKDDESNLFEPAISVDRKADVWGKLWQRDREEIGSIATAIQGLRKLAMSSDHRMDVIDDNEVETAIEGLRNSRGLGLDHWAPLEWKRLPPKAVSRLGDSLRDAERRCTVPLQVLCQLMALMGKPSGGDRTIALQTL